MNQLHKELLKVVEEAFNLTDKKHKEILKLYNDSRNNVRQFIAELYMKYGQDGKLDYDEYIRNHAKEFETYIKKETENIATLEATIASVILGTVLNFTYGKTAYTFDKQYDFKAVIDFKLLRPEVIETITKYNWNGIPFSERIWQNNEMLIRSLRQELAQGLQAGESIDKMAKRINKQFNSKSYQSQRLIRTESSRIINTAQEQFYKEIGVKEVIYTATLDNRTSDICRGLDGKRFKLDDPNKPKIPENTHPNCRSCYLGVPFDDYELSKRKDNISKINIKYKTYEEWAKSKGV